MTPRDLLVLISVLGAVLLATFVITTPTRDSAMLLPVGILMAMAFLSCAQQWRRNGHL
jgi:hypothetical protein